jgi:hypothetical protein
MSATTLPIIRDGYNEARDAAIKASTLNPHLNPVIAVKCVHRFRYEADEFPQGMPLPQGYVIAAVSRPTASGGRRWQRLEEDAPDSIPYGR